MLRFEIRIMALAIWAFLMLSAVAKPNPRDLSTGCPSPYAPYSNFTVGPPSKFKLVVATNSVDQGYLYISPDGHLCDTAPADCTLCITDCQLAPYVNTTYPSTPANASDPSTLPLLYGDEFPDDQIITLSPHQFDMPGAITKTFELVKGQPVMLGSQCVEYYLKWIDASFTTGDRAAIFAIVGGCDGRPPTSGEEVVAMLRGNPSYLEKCYASVMLYAVPA